MKTRNEIITELDKIEAELKSINVEADNNGNFGRTKKHIQLTEREDELMQELQNFPL